MGSQAVSVNGERLWQRLQQLAAIGADPRGGTTRPGYGPTHAEAVRLVAGWMKEAGLQAGLDETGNLIGLLPGMEPGLKAIALGSHLDTVPMGGRFDGALGVVAAIEVAAALQGQLRHPLAVIGFADEEGNNFGIGCLASQLFTGVIRSEQFATIRDRAGRSLADYIDGFKDLGLPVVDRPDLAAYLELHIEQGPSLEAEGRPAAAVEAIVGISRSTLRFTGEANHAGTTPMHLRRDALIGAASLALAVREAAVATAGRAVATVGLFEVRPGATNVIPGEVELRVEMRSADEALMASLRAHVEELARGLASQFGLAVAIAPWHHAPAVPMSPAVVEACRGALTDLGLPDFTMPSWAGHDAKILAPTVPTGMLFVPSKGGWSHSPLEESSSESCTLGANLLLQAALRLDLSTG